MAINYARAAQTDFTEMQMAELRYRACRAGRARRHRRRDRRPGRPPSPTIWTSPPSAAWPTTSKALIAQIRPLVARWRDAARPRRHRRAGKTGPADRRQVRSSDRTQHRSQLCRPPPDRQQYQQLQICQHRRHRAWPCCWRPASPCSCAAASCGRCRAAATVADRIAKGELQTPIPPGGADETGALLKSMTVMQDNIREMMTRETELAPLGRKPPGRTRWKPPRRRHAGGARRQDRDGQQHAARFLSRHRRSAGAAAPASTRRWA